MKCFFITLGCKVNQYESQAALELLEKNGYQIAEKEAEAEVVLINSCTVTSTSDQKVRQTLHRARRKHPNAVIVLTGCLPQAFPDCAGQLPEADVITGNARRAMLPALIQRYLSTRQQVVDIPAHGEKAPFEPMQVAGLHEKTRAFVKIEDGCNRFCSYCIIPTARGRVRSKPLAQLIKELTGFAKAGYQEAVLVGINLPAYGQELGLELCDAVEAACQVEGLERIRLGSLEPDRLHDGVIQRLAAQPKLCPQFHLSLQSGCNKTLRAMNRHYTAEEYRELVEKLRGSIPHTAITTDIMVGFPGESEEDFQASLAFVREIGFAKAHVFAYSRRPGTVAAGMSGQIPQREKERRSRLMLQAAGETRRAFLNAQTGLCHPVLLETASGGFAEGYTANYTPVRINFAGPLQERLCMVRITGNDGDVCFGELAGGPSPCKEGAPVL